MATKPATLPRPWATNVVYTTGPFVGSATAVDPGVGIAAEGHRPGAADPTAAEHENYQQKWTTAWINDWVSAGTALGAAAASIVERNASGKFAVTGFDVAGAVDATAATFTGPNTVAPLITATSTGGGPVMQVDLPAGASTGHTVSMTGAVTGSAYTGTASATSTGSIFSATVPASSSSHSVRITHSSITSPAIYIDGDGVTGVNGINVVTTRGVAARFTDIGPLGCPLVLVPRGSGPTEEGSVYVSNVDGDLHHLDNGGDERRNWNSYGGLEAASQTTDYTNGITTNVAGTVAVQSRNYAFINGQRYWLEMSVELGRFTGSTRNIQISATVGGNPLAFSGFIVELFQSGGATQLERQFRRRIMYTATATGALAVVLQTSVSGGAGNYNWAASTINIEGHYI